MAIFVIIRNRNKHRLFNIDQEDYLKFISVGFCCFLNVVLTILSFQYITPNFYSILQPTIPCIATVISCCVQLEKLTLLKVIGVSIAAFGAIVIEAQAIMDGTGHVRMDIC